MKKLLYSLLTLAAALTVASCQKAPFGDDPTLKGSVVQAELTLDMGQFTKADAGTASTSVFADGKKATKLSYALFESKDNNLTLVKGEKRIAFPDGGKINVKLTRGSLYRFIAWADSENSIYEISEDFKTVTTKIPEAGLVANNDDYDAFYGYLAIETNDEKAIRVSVPLKRPFAQINVLVPEEVITTAGYQSFKSEMTVEQVYTAMKLLDGTLTGDKTDLKFTSAPISEEISGPTIKENYRYLAMNYVFAGTDENDPPYEVSFIVTPDGKDAEAAKVDDLPVKLKRNSRTNLVGNIFNLDQIVVAITPGIEDDATGTDIPEAPDVDVNFATGDAVTTLEIPVLGENGRKSFRITTNSNGAVTVESEDPNTADVVLPIADSESEDGHKAYYDVTVEGKENGTTNLAVSIAAGATKGALRAVSFKIAVVVGTGENPVEQVATPTFDPAAGEIDSGTTVSISSTTAGATIYYTTDGTTAPTTSSTKYEAPIEITEAVTIKAIAIKEGMTDSDVAEAAYTINATNTHGLVADDPFNIPEVKEYIDNLGDAGTISTENVYIKGVITSIVYQFTADHGTATFWIGDSLSSTNVFEAYSVYPMTNKKWVEGDGLVNVNDEVIICGTVYKYNASTYETKTGYIYSWNHAAAAPVFSEEAGVVESGTSVTITSATDGADIYYTTDGTVPTTASTKYTTAISITSDVTIKAIAVASGLRDSGVSTAEYTLPVAGQTEEVISGNFTKDDDGNLVLTTQSGITITQAKGSSSTAPNTSYATATTLRIYIGNTLTFSGKTITKIVFTNTLGNAGGTSISANTGTFTRQENATWEGEASTVVITNTKGPEDTSNIQFRPTKIVVTYKDN